MALIVLTALAPALPWFVAFRIVVGLGVGGASVAAPTYTTELALALAGQRRTGLAS